MSVTRLIALGLLLLVQGCVSGGSLDDAADSLSGAEGQHCVPENTKVGDRIYLPASGTTWTVASLSGTSYRCREPARPMRARLVPALNG